MAPTSSSQKTNKNSLKALGKMKVKLSFPKNKGFSQNIKESFISSQALNTTEQELNSSQLSVEITDEYKKKGRGLTPFQVKQEATEKNNPDTEVFIEYDAQSVASSQPTVKLVSQKDMQNTMNDESSESSETSITNSDHQVEKSTEIPSKTPIPQSQKSPNQTKTQNATNTSSNTSLIKTKSNNLNYKFFLSRDMARATENIIHIPLKNSRTAILDNLGFCLTGILDFMTTENLKKYIEQHGGFFRSGVSKKIDFLIIGRDAGEAKKLKARNNGITQLISGFDLLAMIDPSYDKMGNYHKITKYLQEKFVDGNEQSTVHPRYAVLRIIEKLVNEQRNQGFADMGIHREKIYEDVPVYDNGEIDEAIGWLKEKGRIKNGVSEDHFLVA